MTDKLWEAAYRALLPLLRPGDTILAPRGDWPFQSARVKFYKGRIELGGASVLMLHKGQLAAIRKSDLAVVWRDWQCVFANNVFVCFVKGRRVWLDQRLTWRRRYTRLLRDYLNSPQLKRRVGTLFILHIPKTAGTAVWKALGRRVRSKLYYDCIEAFLFNPPAPGEFDLVGGHVAVHFLLSHLQPKDHLAGLLRDPTARFRSAFLHSRRQDEDPGTFMPDLRAMRETGLDCFLPTHDADLVLHQQLLMLGFSFDRPYSSALDEEILQRAMEIISRANVHVFPVERIDDLARLTCNLLGIPTVRMARLNTAERVLIEGSLAEFEASAAVVEDLNRSERDLYEFVRLNGEGAAPP